MIVQIGHGMARPCYSADWADRRLRSPSENQSRSQKRSYQEKDDNLIGLYREGQAKCLREQEWCPVCRKPVTAGVIHQCAALIQSSGSTQPEVSLSGVRVSPEKNSRGSASGIPPHLNLESLNYQHHGMPEQSSDSHFLNRNSNHNPSISRLADIPANCAHSTVHKGKHVFPDDTSQTFAPSAVSPQEDDANFPTPVLAKGHSLRAEQTSSTWSNELENSKGKLEKWETPTSLISRLTAGLTTSTGLPQDDRSSTSRSCASPSNSESSEASSFFSHREPYHYEDPFVMAHQELVDETTKHEQPPVIQKPPKLSKDRQLEDVSERRGRSRSQMSSESVYSEAMHGDSNTYGSQDSDMEDSTSTYLDADGQLPDIDTLLKSIKEPDLIPYVPDKLAINKYLEPHEVGHINHLIKSLSDAMLTINLPETLYKNKGFTPLDYMDIHLNAVIRHFFFVFKNEDFLNLLLPDQMALLDGCSLGAVCCSGLYLFSKESGCWYIPGATGKINHPVIHISDLMQVYPQQFVTRIFDLHTTAAKLGFDWPMGVITQCILMYTPIGKVIKEIEKIDTLRNKYVKLLLKYVTWKNGPYNASQVFPEILKLLDAVLLLVEELATTTLNLTAEEVLAVEDRLSTLTVSQIATLQCQPNPFKDPKVSWPSLKYVNLGEIQTRLCMAMHISMLDSLQMNNPDCWAGSSMCYSFSLPRDSEILSPRKKLPQLMSGKDGCTNAESSIHSNHTKNKGVHSSKDIMAENEYLAEKDLMLLRRFLEDVTDKESSLIVKGIREKMDSNMIKLIIDKLCS
ncbi:uncharacterized protein LOC119582526 [Penaeus monodon]|uniref:uncharacterized protein LOC119582526 n=1 Tax=Penaeus monodon TaxID=6687 RepID=UPI0018A74BA4|nr:uncharacterized protein LOC119582526 [Penaeus monodon]XP_037786764.1 uncharacterized protein LOC119582526 [Penaeus monodon]